MSDKLYIHLHCGKTGGTTLNHALEQIFDSTERISLHCNRHNGRGILLLEDVLEKWNALIPEAKKSARQLGGHLPVDLLKHIDVPFIAFGMVRNPLDRVLSAFCYNSQRLNKLNETFVRETFERYEEKTGVHNPQTRFYAGVDPSENITENHLKTAIENIENYFSWVYPTERLNTLVEQIIISTGCQKSIKIETQNVTQQTPFREIIKYDYGKKIDSCMGFDHALYQYVLNLN